jgi:hypothetical protein
MQYLTVVHLVTLGCFATGGLLLVAHLRPGYASGRALDGLLYMLYALAIVSVLTNLDGAGTAEVSVAVMELARTKHVLSGHLLGTGYWAALVVSLLYAVVVSLLLVQHAARSLRPRFTLRARRPAAVDEP